MSSCSLTKLVPEEKQLLVKNKIEHTTKTKVDISEQSEYLRQKPNRQMLGIYRFHLRTYNTGARGLEKGKDSTRWRNLLVNIGEAPVIVDSLKCQLSANKLSDYYFSKGFLENKVSYEIRTKKFYPRRAKVIYKVNLGQYKKIKSVSYFATSFNIDRLVDSAKAASFVKAGRRLDFDAIQAERNRITQLLRDNGYYYFNNSYVDFSLDTSQVKGQAIVLINLRNNRNSEPHMQQRINKVVVMIGIGESKDTIVLNGLQFLENSYYINPAVLAKNIYFRPGELYKAADVQRTYSSLLSIGLFRFVTIRFSPSTKDSLSLLDAEIILQTASKHDFIWEPQAITTEQGSGIQAASERNYGIGNNISLRNRNVFGNAESFNISSNTSLETQLKADSIKAFSNLRQSISAEFVIPSLLFFDAAEKAKKYNSKNTSFTLSYLYDKNVNYVRNVLPFNFAYTFQKKRTVYALTPLRFSFNRATVEQSFLDELTPATRIYIRQLLTNNLITGPVLSLYWHNKLIHPKNYWTIRTTPLELSGNMFSAYYSLTGKDTGYNKEVFGVKYSQYIRSEFDASYNITIDENNSLAYRFYGGVGFPYGNTKFLPFERRFFVGGGNSLRAWRPRTIGPGNYSDSTNNISIDKTGEIMLQANLEYRFDIIDQLLNGALFVDAGNIWNIKEDENFPRGNFEFDNFYKEIAINTGLGFRWDLSYLIFRIDWGIALHDPSQLEGNRWVIKDFRTEKWISRHTALNFAVGYPF